MSVGVSALLKCNSQQDNHSKYAPGGLTKTINIASLNSPTVSFGRRAPKLECPPLKFLFRFYLLNSMNFKTLQL